MALETFTSLTFARGNIVTPALVTSVVTTNITTFLGGFPASNLEYGDDPWTVMKTGSVSGGTVSIEHQFTGSAGPRVLGILNHNIGVEGGYTSVTVEFWTGSAWSAVATMGISTLVDTPIWIAWTAAGPATRWRFSLIPLSTGGNFYIGGIFYGSTDTLSKNPMIMNQTLSETLLVETAAGGSKHVTFGANVRNQIAEFTFSRLPGNDAEVLRKFGKQELIGILTPEHADANSLIGGQEVFWGYIHRRTVTPRGPGKSLDNTWHYDVTLEMEGAV